MEQTFIRIGSSKEKLSKFPEWEIRLLNVLSNEIPTVVNTAAPDYAQNLTFEKLFLYYGAKGIALRQETFKKTLKLQTADGRYNIMALLLSDSNDIPIRVSVFSGKTKADTLFSVKEYGNSCILYAMGRILDYGDAINIIQADERGVPKIVGAYGRESIRIEKNFIVVTIPFNRINVTPFELNDGEESALQENATVNLSSTQKKILAALSENAYVTQAELAEKIGIHRTRINDNMAKLKEMGIIKRIGAEKAGHWEIVK